MILRRYLADSLGHVGHQHRRHETGEGSERDFQPSRIAVKQRSQEDNYAHTKKEPDSDSNRYDC